MASIAMIVVSDTSPLRALDHLGHLDLLASLYGVVWLPPAVAYESLQPRSLLPIVDVSKYAFLRIKSPQDVKRVQYLLQHLDPGEAEAIALAVELKADVVLLDERRARRIAAQTGLHTVGALGVLLEAKLQGLIPAVRPLMERLITEIRFFVSPALQAKVLQAAGE